VNTASVESSLRRFVAGVDALMRAVRGVIAVVLVCSVALNFANVAGRKFFSAPISGAEEVMNFLMVVVVFLGAGVVAYDGTHINMEIVLDRFPPRVATALRVLAQAAAIAVAAIVVKLGVPIIDHLRAFDERSQAANVPLWIPQSAVPIGLTLLALGALARIAVLVVPAAETRNA
jgi:TRAP-type C4-dicarboxylate transport system permease small subunit